MQKKRQIRKLIYLQNIEIFKKKIKHMKLHYAQTREPLFSPACSFTTI